MIHNEGNILGEKQMNTQQEQDDLFHAEK